MCFLFACCSFFFILQSAQMATFTAPQIGGLNVTAATAIANNNDLMGPGCAGWTAEQFNVMPTAAFCRIQSRAR